MYRWTVLRLSTRVLPAIPLTFRRLMKQPLPGLTMQSKGVPECRHNAGIDLLTLRMVSARTLAVRARAVGAAVGTSSRVAIKLAGHSVKVSGALRCRSCDPADAAYVSIRLGWLDRKRGLSLVTGRPGERLQSARQRQASGNLSSRTPAYPWRGTSCSC